MDLDLQKMSREEKLRTMHRLWEDLARDDEAVESPAWHRDALKETEERVRSGVEGIRDWEQAKGALRKRER